MEHDSQLVSSDSENERENVNTPEPENDVADYEFDNIMNELYYNDPTYLCTMKMVKKFL